MNFVFFNFDKCVFMRGIKYTQKIENFTSDTFYAFWFVTFHVHVQTI